MFAHYRVILSSLAKTWSLLQIAGIVQGADLALWR